MAGRPDEELVSEVVGPCRLVSCIGAGGMGTVFRAELLEARPYAQPGGAVALKLLRARLIDEPVARERFDREARLGASIRHPGVVVTHESGVAIVDGTARPYLIMEHVAGRTLRALIDEEGALPEPLLREIGARLASALAAVHAAGAVHRDVKTSNVLITPDNDVKLMDLGVARIEGLPALTAADVFLGSFVSASPEQFGRGEVGPASDLYSLGVLLHEAAVGRTPFVGHDMAGFVRSHLFEVPPRLGELVGAMTLFFEEVVACLLEKDPARRFASAAHLAATLEGGESSAWWRERAGTANVRGGRSRTPDIPVRRDTRMVGRRAEAERLASAFADVAAGQGRVVLVEGEAGIGKTRLIADLLHDSPALAGARVLYGSFPPGGSGDARSVLAEAIASHFNAAELEREMARYLEVPARAPALAAWLRGSTPPPGVDAMTRGSVHAQLRSLVRGLAAERPTVVILEDLHFAGADDLALLAALAREVHGRPLMLVLTFRPGLPAEALAAIERSEDARHLVLPRLRQHEIVDLLAQAVASASVGHELGRLLGPRSDGNPLFVLEMVRDLERRAILRPRAPVDSGSPTGSPAGGRVLEIADDVESIEAPSSVRSLVLARIAALDPSERDLLDAGAVQGHSFDPDLVARVLGRDLLDVLRALAAVERRTGIVRGSGSAFRFDHHQIQEVVYAAIPQALRNEYHARIAAEFETREGLAGAEPGSVPGSAAVFIVRHGVRAGNKATARRLMVRALHALEAEFQYEAQIELALEARALLGDGDPRLTFEIILKQEEGLNRLGRRAAERLACAELQAAAAASGDPICMIRANSTQGRLHLATGEHSAALDAYQRSLAASLAASFVRGEANARQGLGTTYREMARLDLALGEHEKALAAWQLLGEDLKAASERMNIGSVLAEMGRYEEARPPAEQGLAVFQARRAPNHLAAAFNNLGWIHYCTGDLILARQRWDAALSIAREHGYAAALALLHANLGEIDVVEGRLDSGEARLQEALATSRRADDRRAEAFGLHRLGDVAQARGDLPGAAAFFEQALALRRAMGGEGLADSALALGRLRLESGDAETARAQFEEAASLGALHAIADVGPLPDAYLVLMGARDATSVVVHDRCPVRVRAEAHFVMYRAAGDVVHLDAARELLRRLSAHLQGDALATFWRVNPLARSVAAEGP